MPRALPSIIVLCLAAVAAAVLTVVSPACAAGGLQRDKAQARELAAQVSSLDARIGVAVRDYAQATATLDAVRADIRDNRRRQRVGRAQLQRAREMLTEHAVALYKHGMVTSLDALLEADDFAELVNQLAMVEHFSRGDRDTLRAVTTTQRELRDTARLLAAAVRTKERLVARCGAELEQVRTELSRRKALLAGVRAEIRTLAAGIEARQPSSGSTVEPPENGGSGSWWSAIKQAASANGISVRGLYRLMMAESGGSATVTSASGFCGLFQYAPSTWRGSWNPYRAADIFDGAAQIKATALAIRLGHGSSWWGAAYSWAFGG